MTLLDLRRYAIRNRARIRFSVPAAGECAVDEHGLLRIPGLRTAASVNVEALLDSVEQFVVEPVREGSKQRKVSREELHALLGEAPKAEAGHEE